MGRRGAVRTMLGVAATAKLAASAGMDLLLCSARDPALRNGLR